MCINCVHSFSINFLWSIVNYILFIIHTDPYNKLFHIHSWCPFFLESWIEEPSPRAHSSTLTSSLNRSVSVQHWAKMDRVTPQSPLSRLQVEPNSHLLFMISQVRDPTATKKRTGAFFWRAVRWHRSLLNWARIGNRDTLEAPHLSFLPRRGRERWTERETRREREMCMHSDTLFLLGHIRPIPPQPSLRAATTHLCPTV